jgi:hypothetical protein
MQLLLPAWLIATLTLAVVGWVTLLLMISKPRLSVA